MLQRWLPSFWSLVFGVLRSTGGMPFLPLGHAGQAGPRFGALNTLDQPSGGAATSTPLAPKGMRVPYVVLQRRMIDAFSDCKPSLAKERLVLNLQAARSTLHLWQLRSDVYDLVATQFMQQEAARRINALTPQFKGWVPDRQLTLL